MTSSIIGEMLIGLIKFSGFMTAVVIGKTLYERDISGEDLAYWLIIFGAYVVWGIVLAIAEALVH